MRASARAHALTCIPARPLHGRPAEHAAEQSAVLADMHDLAKRAPASTPAEHTSAVLDAAE